MLKRDCQPLSLAIVVTRTTVASERRGQDREIVVEYVDMNDTTPKPDARATIKVCLEPSCRQRGAENVLRALKLGFAPEEALVMPASRCLSGCGMGPNIAVNDNIIRGVAPISVVEKVRSELDNPSCKADGIGSRSIDDLDSVLDDIDLLDSHDKA